MKGFSGRGRLWSLFDVLAAVLVVALVTAACGSSSPSSTVSTSPGPSSAGSVTVDGVAINENPALHALLPKSILAAGQIRACAEIPYPPWEMYVGATSQPAGFDYDLSQALGAVLGIKVSFNNQPFDSIILSVQAGKNDMIISDMSDTAAREKAVTFVDYAREGTSALVVTNNPQGITADFESLSGKIVGADIATTQQVLLQNLNKQFASSGKKQMQIIILPSNAAVILALKSGRVDAALMDNSTAQYIAHTTDNGTTFKVVPEPAAPEALIGIGILKTNTQLVAAIQKALQELIDKRAYTTIINKYGLLPVTSARLNGATQAASTTGSTSQL